MSSRFAHPYAPSVASKASSKRAQPVVGVQFGASFSKYEDARREFAIPRVKNVKVEGLDEIFK